MNQHNGVIGVFDSGIGGITILSEIVELLPTENYIYYGDGASLPLGEKSREEILSVSDRAVSYLVEHGAKIIVLACNTVTSVAKEYLRSKHNIPIVGIEPAVKMAVSATKRRAIGVIATRSTIEGKMLSDLCQRWASDCRVEFKIGRGLVEMVEKSSQLNYNDLKLLKEQILELTDKGVDIIVLGCTHYPFLRSEIEEILKGQDVEVIDPAPFVARRVYNILNEMSLFNKIPNCGKIKFTSSLDKEYNLFMEQKYHKLRDNKK